MSEIDKSQFAVVMIGNPKFSRYAIMDKRQDYCETRFWRGDSECPWTSAQHLAMKFADFGSADDAIRDVIAHEYKDAPVKEFVLPLKFQVFGDTTPEQVKAYIAKTLSFMLDYKSHGMGPTPDSVMLVNTNLNDLEDATSLSSHPEQLRPHQKVKILTGPYRGLKGMVTRIKSRQPVKVVAVRVTIWDQTKMVDFEPWQLGLDEDATKSKEPLS
jgi:hypothetical protein